MEPEKKVKINGGSHTLRLSMVSNPFISGSRKMDDVNLMLKEKTEMVVSLEKKLNKKEFEMITMETRYKKYLGMAAEVIKCNEEESKTENMKEETECVVCFSQYNDKEHRPRSLPCGHTLCTKCLEEAILNKTRKCPKCRTDYVASNVKNIPVNYSLERVSELLNSHKNNEINDLPESKENLLAKKEIITETTKPETVPECVEHQLPLSKRCSTHKAWICENCLRGDHSSESCNIITLSEELNVKKSAQLTQSKSFLDKFEKASKKSDELRKQCQDQRKEWDEEITCFENIVKRKLEVIQCKKESRKRLEGICNDFDQKLQTLKSKRMCYGQAVISLNSSDTFRKVYQYSTEVQNESEKLQLITNDIRYETDKIILALNIPRDSSIGLSLGNHISTVRDGMYHLHAIQGKTTVQSHHYSLQITDEIESAPATDGILTFLDIAWPGQQPQRIYIKMMGNTCRARQHLLLAVGQCGHSYRGLYFEKLLYKDQPGELLKICAYDGADAKPLLSDVTVNDILPRDVKVGLVTGVAMDDDTDDSNTALFAVYLKDDPGYVSSSVFGSVTSGLDVLKKIADSDEMETIKIVDCGVVLF